MSGPHPVSETPNISTLDPVTVSISTAACPLDRYYFEPLALRVHPFVPQMEEQSLLNFFATEVNDPQYDRVPGNISGDFTPENSISGFEAFQCSRDLFLQGGLDDETEEGGVGRGLAAVFLGGDYTFHTIPPPHYVVFRRCHDGDTCTVLEMQEASCQLSSVETAVRISGIDAPEVGYYPTGEGSGWVNTKLVENVDKLRKEWLGDVQYSNAVMRDINRLIALHIDYTGRLAGLIRNDLNTWNGSDGVPRQIEESVINWVWEGKGERTPPMMCGTWQPFDKFGRRLGSFYQLYPSYLESYIRLRLPGLMAGAGMEKYEQYLKKAAPILKRLKNVEIDKVQGLVARFENDLPDPSAIFSPPQCALMAETFLTFVAQHGEHYRADDQILQIIVGSVFGYEKYRNQDGDVYQAANDLARERGFGFWDEETFKTTYIINEQDPRYHPPHCPAQ